MLRLRTLVVALAIGAAASLAACQHGGTSNSASQPTAAPKTAATASAEAYHGGNPLVPHASKTPDTSIAAANSAAAKIIHMCSDPLLAKVNQVLTVGDINDAVSYGANYELLGCSTHPLYHSVSVTYIDTTNRNEPVGIIYAVGADAKTQWDDEAQGYKGLGTYDQMHADAGTFYGPGDPVTGLYNKQNISFMACVHCTSISSKTVFFLVGTGDVNMGVTEQDDTVLNDLGHKLIARTK